MTICGYKITDDENKQAQNLLQKHIPHTSSRIDYDKYFEMYLTLEQLQILCKYFGCNISNLARDVARFKAANNGGSTYKCPPDISKND